MKRSFLFILVLIACSSKGVESDFVFITPDTEDDHKSVVEISFAQIPNSPDRYRVKLEAYFYIPEAPAAGLRVWLVIAAEELSKDKQVIGDITEDVRIRDDLLLITELVPKYELISGKFKPSHFEVFIDKSLITRSYIFIGHEGEVMDGGTRYSIDLGSYYDKLLPDKQRLHSTYLKAEDDEVVKSGEAEV